MGANRGKQFESVFAEDISTVPGCCCIRLNDQQSGYYGSKNICDFIVYKYPLLFLIECKCIEGNTFPICKLTQYQKLLAYSSPNNGVIGGMVLWYISHDAIYFVPVSTVTTYISQGKKSINIKDIESIDKTIKISTIKKRVFVHGDYSEMLKESKINT